MIKMNFLIDKGLNQTEKKKIKNQINYLAFFFNKEDY